MKPIRIAMLHGAACAAMILATGCARTTSPSAPGDLSPAPEVRVLIIETLDSVNVTPLGSYRAEAQGRGPLALNADLAHELRVADDGSVVLALDGAELLRTPELRIASDNPAALLAVEGVPYGVGWWWESLQDRSYPGDFLVRTNAEGMLDVIVTLPVEEYLLGVVPQEIGPDSPMEALKAQALAARTETMIALETGKYAGDGYDICADVMCQAYSGTARYSESTAEAIAATRGLVLTYNGEMFSAYYASNCGGHSENIENVWADRGGPSPQWTGVPDTEDPDVRIDLSSEERVVAWLESNPDVYCNPVRRPDLPGWTHQNFRWVREFSAEEMAKHVARHQDIGRVIRIEAINRGVSGRMIEARFVGELGEFTIGPELAIRQVFDPPLRSAAFVVETQGNPSLPEHFTIRGAGWGHGVGMCQTGAIGRAMDGWDFTRILAHYYRESEIERRY